jgi:hypothetical protein
MKMHITTILVLGVLYVSGSVLGDEALQFEIAKGKIDLVRIWIYPNGQYGVDLELKPPYQKEFAGLLRPS